MIYIEFIIKSIIIFIFFILYFEITKILFNKSIIFKKDEILFCSITYSLTDIILERLKVNELAVWIFDIVIMITSLNIIYRGVLIPLTRRRTNERNNSNEPKDNLGS